MKRLKFILLFLVLLSSCEKDDIENTFVQEQMVTNVTEQLVVYMPLHLKNAIGQYLVANSFSYLSDTASIITVNSGAKTYSIEIKKELNHGSFSQV